MFEKKIYYITSFILLREYSSANYLLRGVIKCIVVVTADWGPHNQ